MYQRILLKLSGEALSPREDRLTLDVNRISSIAEIIKELNSKKVQVGVVIGAGNIWRGKLADLIGIERVPADYMGMMGTVINCVALCSALKKIGVKSKVFSAICDIDGVCESYDQAKAIKSLEEGNVTFFAGGTGKPYFTTDTAATLRALEVKCDAILMAKYGVEGVYDKDPRKYSDAKFLKDITYKDVIDMKLEVMDQSAVELVKDSDMILKVFSMEDSQNIIKAAMGEDVGTTVRKG